MNILLVGAGMMGRRHLTALLRYSDADIYLYDKYAESYEIVKKEVQESDIERIKFLNHFDQSDNKYDGAIIATSAENRLKVIEDVLNYKVKNILIEKPVEQSLRQYQQVVDVVNKHDALAYVNFTRRTYVTYTRLFKIFNTTSQFKGYKQVTILGGAVGIGCNGSHLIDLIFYLMGASRIKFKYGEINDILIPSGRGANYCDFGGEANFSMYNVNDELVAGLNIALNSQSTAPYIISIIGEHGRIDIDEIKGQYTITSRSEDSKAPVYRYYQDYDGFKSYDLNFEGLHKGAEEWLKTFSSKNADIQLPKLQETQEVHKAIFAWLSKSKQFKNVYPIT